MPVHRSIDDIAAFWAKIVPISNHTQTHDTHIRPHHQRDKPVVADAHNRKDHPHTVNIKIRLRTKVVRSIIGV